MTEVIIYAAIATLICVMLYSVLGKSVGRGPEAPLEGLDLNPEINKKPAIIDPVVESGVFPELIDVKKMDSSFTTDKFLDSARGAYAMILEAFAQGDRDELKMLLTPNVYDVYNEALAQREEKGHKQVTDLGRIIDSQIVEVQLRNNVALLSVEFSSELASALIDESGQTIEGDPDLLRPVNEVWTFERNLKSSSPAWYLFEVAPAQSGDGPVDAAPNTSV